MFYKAKRLNEEITTLTRKYVLYGHHMIAGMPNNNGWHMNHKPVEQI